VGGFLFCVENWAEQLSTDFEPGFPSLAYCHFTTKQVCISSFEKWALPILTRVKSSLEALLEEFSKSDVTERL